MERNKENQRRIKKHRLLVINDEVKADIARVKQYAADHVFSLARIISMISGEERVGDDPGFQITIPMDYLVCYSMEMQPPPLNLCHHISISINDKDPKALPHPIAVNAILTEFGIDVCFPYNKAGIPEWDKPPDHLDLEDISMCSGRGPGAQAVNIITRVNP